MANIKRQLRQHNTAEARFALAGIKVTEDHGGRPTTSLNADGEIQFTYPDGTATVGGRKVS